MNALDLIKNDHQTVNQLLGQIEQIQTKQQSGQTNQMQGGQNQSSTSGQTSIQGRKELLDQIKGALQVHEQMEESIFYPALVKKEKELIKEAYLEHDLVDQLMADLENESTTDDEWMAKFTVFKEMIQHHVEEEENEIFQKARDILDNKRLEELGRQMENFKRQKAH